jgi:hypothetical protein
MAFYWSDGTSKSAGAEFEGLQPLMYGDIVFTEH